MSLTLLLWKLDNGKQLDAEEACVVVECLKGKKKKEINAWAKTMNVNPKNLKKSLDQGVNRGR